MITSVWIRREREEGERRRDEREGGVERKGGRKY